MSHKILLPVICGPTASGKTALAAHLALQMNGEVISADSMQVYTGMPVLSALPSQEEMLGVPHHMLSCVSPREKFSAAAYRDAAVPIIEDVAARGKTPILTGGTGLYINAVTRPMGFAEKGDENIRAALEKEAQEADGRAKLHERLSSVDPETAQKLHPNDVRRVVRALEIYALTGRPQSELIREDKARSGDYDERLFALAWPREELYRRIDVRVEEMLKDGLVEEVQALMRDPQTHATASQAIGYKEIAAALRGETRMEEAVEDVKRATRNYAKRQITWFSRDARVTWIPAQDRRAEEIASEIAYELQQ